MRNNFVSFLKFGGAKYRTEEPFVHLVNKIQHMNLGALVMQINVNSLLSEARRDNYSQSLKRADLQFKTPSR